MPPPIIVTGCARSGTSLTAGILHRCGAFGGTMRGPNPANPRGQFENIEIVSTLVKPYLRNLGVDPLGQKPLPDPSRCWGDAARLDWRRKIEGIMRRQGYPGGPWLYKGAKACLVWPLWHEAFPEAKWVIVRREDSEIVASCLRTSFMRAYQDEAGWQGWVEAHKRRFAEMRERVDVREVWPWRAIAGDLSKFRELAGCLGLKWNEAAAREFVSPDLWHGGRGDGRA